MIEIAGNKFKIGIRKTAKTTQQISSRIRKVLQNELQK
jgi:hypothetical protein